MNLFIKRSQSRLSRKGLKLSTPLIRALFARIEEASGMCISEESYEDFHSAVVDVLAKYTIEQIEDTFLNDSPSASINASEAPTVLSEESDPWEESVKNQAVADNVPLVTTQETAESNLSTVELIDSISEGLNLNLANEDIACINDLVSSIKSSVDSQEETFNLIKQTILTYVKVKNDKLREEKENIAKTVLSDNSKVLNEVKDTTSWLYKEVSQTSQAIDDLNALRIKYQALIRVKNTLIFSLFSAVTLIFFLFPIGLRYSAVNSNSYLEMQCKEGNLSNKICP